jgi:hypothetical protein
MLDMNTPFRTAALVVLVLTLLPACISSQEQAAPSESGDATVQVSNNNFLDVTIYAVRDAQRYRLGRVTTARTETFTLPGHLINGPTLIAFVADPIGSDEAIFLERLSIVPGAEVFLSVPSHN